MAHKSKHWPTNRNIGSQIKTLGPNSIYGSTIRHTVFIHNSMHRTNIPLIGLQFTAQGHSSMHWSKIQHIGPPFLKITQHFWHILHVKKHAQRAEMVLPAAHYLYLDERSRLSGPRSFLYDWLCTPCILYSPVTNQDRVRVEPGTAA